MSWYCTVHESFPNGWGEGSCHIVNDWEESKIPTSLVVVWGLHPLLLSISDKETLPEGNTFGCNITGLNEPKIKKLTLTFDLMIVSWQKAMQQLKRYLVHGRFDELWNSFYLVLHSFMTLTFLLYCANMYIFMDFKFNHFKSSHTLVTRLHVLSISSLNIQDACPRIAIKKLLTVHYRLTFWWWKWVILRECKLQLI